MSSKLVTLNQVKSVQDMANAKGVGRENFQKGLDDGRVARFLDSLMTPIVAPQGARIHHNLHVRVKMDREWQEVVNVAGPNTPDHYNVRKVGNRSLPTGTDEVEEDLVLLNYPLGDGNWDKALAWAKTVNLNNTVPREVFAIGERHPNLHRELGCNTMYTVATTECSFGGSRQACCVWWDGSRRGAYLGWLGFFDDSFGWFVFRK